MNNISHDQAKGRKFAKIAGLCALATLAVSFFAMPLTSFAKCGGGGNNAAAQALKNAPIVHISGSADPTTKPTFGTNNQAPSNMPFVVQAIANPSAKGATWVGQWLVGSIKDPKTGKFGPLQFVTLQAGLKTAFATNGNLVKVQFDGPQVAPGGNGGTGWTGQ
jgi:hypothetical protein